MAFDFTNKVDPKASRAIYLQLLDMIQGQIQDKSLKPGDMLPSEKEFCQHYQNHSPPDLSRTRATRVDYPAQRLGHFYFGTQGIPASRQPLQLHRRYEKAGANAFLSNFKLPPYQP